MKEEKKKEFEAPKIEIITFSEEDIIKTSGLDDFDNSGNDIGFGA